MLVLQHRLALMLLPLATVIGAPLRDSIQTTRHPRRFSAVSYPSSSSSVSEDSTGIQIPNLTPRLFGIWQDSSNPSDESHSEDSAPIEKPESAQDPAPEAQPSPTSNAADADAPAPAATTPTPSPIHTAAPSSNSEGSGADWYRYHSWIRLMRRLVVRGLHDRILIDDGYDDLYTVPMPQPLQINGGGIPAGRFSKWWRGQAWKIGA